MKCRMGSGNKAKKGTHVQMQRNANSKNGERGKTTWEKTLPRKEVSTNILKNMKEGLNKTPQGKIL